MPFGFKEDDSERGNDASEDRQIHQLVIGFERRIQPMDRNRRQASPWSFGGLSKPALFQEIACA
jgi:hypothetical protein